MDVHAQHRLNDLDGLSWLGRFGWLRTQELGALMWPGARFARQQADRLVRSWRVRGLVLERTLPAHAGRAVVLASGGVRLLAEAGVEAVSGKDIGETCGGQWQPPHTWRHDLIAAGVLADLHARGFDVLPEYFIRRHAGLMAKLPDGLAVRGDHVIWLEAESTRKTGPAMRLLAQALSAVAVGEAAPVCGHRPTNAMVAFLADARDERGHALGHQTRVRRAVAEAACQDVQIAWARCTLKGSAGVGSVVYEAEAVMADRAAKVRRVLDAGGWREQDGCWVANYGQQQARVWEDDDAPGLWGWEATGQADRAFSKEAAKQACASALAA